MFSDNSAGSGSSDDSDEGSDASAESPKKEKKPAKERKEREDKPKAEKKEKAVSEKPRKQRKKKDKDDNKPKRPQTAFMLWLNNERETIKADNPGIKVTEIAKKGGELWKELKDKSVSSHTFIVLPYSTIFKTMSVFYLFSKYFLTGMGSKG